MPVEAKLILSKSFPPGISEIKFGRYKIQPIPPSSATEIEAILTFINTYKDPKDGSHPEEEANIVCGILSLFLDTRIKKTGIRINKIDIPVIEVQKQERAIYPQFFGVVDHSQTENYLKRVLSLEEDLARQFIRACRTYSFALEFILLDQTFAFFLLVVAIECMSSQEKIIPFSKLNPDSKKCERFCYFITSFSPKKCRGDVKHNDRLFKKLLKTAYYSHRSGFVHGGKEVSAAVLKADVANSSYFKHVVEGKEVKTPGIGWFAKVVRGAILGYLNSLPTPSYSRIDEQLFSRLANEKAILKVKLKRKIEKGRFVFYNDINYR